MPDFALAAADDPLGLASGVIQLVSVEDNAVKEYSETLGDNARWIDAAAKVLRPRREGTCSYELLDTASLVLAFGAAVNTNLVITSASVNMSSTSRPTVQVGWMRPSNINKLKAYPTAITLTVAGGFGVVSNFGATIADSQAAVSSTCSIEMQTADAGLGADADYLQAGLYYYGFKKSCTLQAYGAITIPSAGKETSKSNAAAVSRDGWKVFSAAWWEYMHAITA
jgi:hypothetical protein